LAYELLGVLAAADDPDCDNVVVQGVTIISVGELVVAVRVASELRVVMVWRKDQRGTIAPAAHHLRGDQLRFGRRGSLGLQASVADTENELFAAVGFRTRAQDDRLYIARFDRYVACVDYASLISHFPCPSRHR
jgi:hypothetical protein